MRECSRNPFTEPSSFAASQLVHGPTPELSRRWRRRSRARCEAANCVRCGSAADDVCHDPTKDAEPMDAAVHVLDRMRRPAEQDDSVGWSATATRHDRPYAASLPPKTCPTARKGRYLLPLNSAVMSRSVPPDRCFSKTEPHVPLISVPESRAEISWPHEKSSSVDPSLQRTARVGRWHVK